MSVKCTGAELNAFLDERLNDICPRLDIKVTAQHKRVIPNGR